MATDRLPAGLSISAFIAILSLGAVALWGGFREQHVNGPEHLVHTMAGLCLLWSAVAYLVSRVLGLGTVAPVEEGNQHAVLQTAAKRGELGIGHDLISVLQIASMFTGLLAVIVMLYIASLEMLCRTVYLEYQFPWQVKLWGGGLIDIGVVGAGLVLHWLRTRHEHLITAIFWLLVFAAVWFSSQIPSHQTVDIGSIGYDFPSRWASVLLGLLAGLVFIWTLAEGQRLHRWRMTAWPNALSQLVTPPVSWPGFHYSAGVVAVIVLCLGCVHIALPWTIVSAFLAGGSMLALTHREWNENLADAGLALFTLGVVSLCMLGLDAPIWSSQGYADVLNRALIGLAIMTWFWHWQARTWRQQLDHGQPWTTAGRLIRPVRRVGFIVAMTAVLISLHLSLWPHLRFVVDLDTDLSRWVLGFLGNGLLILALLSAIRDTNRRTLAWLVLFAAASLVAFTLVRAPNSWFAQLWSLYWPLLMTGVAAGSLLLVSYLSTASQWRSLIEPLVFTGILIAPLSAVSGVSMAEDQSLPPWLPAATYGCLTAVYLLAAIVPGPATFSVVAVFCGLVGMWHLRRFAGSNILPPVYFYGVLCGLSLALTAMVYRHQVRPEIVRLLKWVGGSIVLISVIAGFISRM